MSGLAIKQQLDKEPGPKLLRAGLALFGTKEIVGDENNPVILGWAKALGLTQYTNDEQPWCGLWMAWVCHLAGKPVVKDPLWARNWCKWGEHCEPELGCILIFSRPGGGGHVGEYAGEDEDSYFVLGGNEGNKVDIVPIAKARLLDSRCLFVTGKPANVRKIFIAPDGTPVSTNEA